MFRLKTWSFCLPLRTTTILLATIDIILIVAATTYFFTVYAVDEKLQENRPLFVTISVFLGAVLLYNISYLLAVILENLLWMRCCFVFGVVGLISLGPVSLLHFIYACSQWNTLEILLGLFQPALIGCYLYVRLLLLNTVYHCTKELD